MNFVSAEKKSPFFMDSMESTGYSSSREEKKAHVSYL